MQKKKFQCRVEDLPMLGLFILSSLKQDINDFAKFSSIFTPEYIRILEEKINMCRDLVSSSIIVKELKAVTQQLSDKSNGLRLKLNILEGYIRLSAQELDISEKDTGLREVRDCISRHNTEGLVANTKKLLTVTKRNQTILETKGLNPTLFKEIEDHIQEIVVLNTKQNDLISERNRLTQNNIEVSNDLWEYFQPVLKAAKAIYKGVNDVKLKDYTLSQLLKRIHATKKKDDPEEEED
ncbi:MAG: hypothetical protein LBG80_11230 [Bacteroidales bacterium]|jgi:hypothetical protein|nr:hypothetical protein [Bacteroidales bacterium]